MRRHTLVGTLNHGTRHPRVFISWEYDGSPGRFSVSGVVAPQQNGDAIACGQCSDVFDDDAFVPADGIDVLEIAKLWKRWHLNDMNAGCSHQRERWNLKGSIGEDLKGFNGHRVDGLPMAIWVSQDEHPNGLLSRICYECGYEFGTEWKFEAVPVEVVRFFEGLPDDSAKLPGAWK